MAEATTPPLLYTRLSSRAKLLLFGGFAIFFLCIRIPEFAAQWDGQDGNGQLSAMLMGLSSANEMIFSRIDGQDHNIVGFAHPLPPYLLIWLIGKVVGLVVPLANLHGQTLIFALKATVTVLQLCHFSRVALSLRFVTRAALLPSHGSG